jgi:hypothetical protein
VTQSEFLNAIRIAVEECFDSEFLNEPLKFARGDLALEQIDKVRSNSAFGKEANRFSRIGALLHTENLHFHGKLRW